MDSQIPSSIQPLLAEFLSHLQEQLGTTLAGLYVQGSIALGAYTEGQSDIDFVAVLNRQASAHEIGVLQALHRHLREKYPRPALEGQYLQASQLGRQDHELDGYPNYHDGVLHPDDHHGLNLVMWWLLKNQGVTLRGTPAQALPITVDWNRLVSEMVVNLNTYWAGWTREPDKFIRLYTDSGFQWAVLGVLRQFYTFREKSITSKVGAGEYGLKVLPEEWKPVVQEALALREGRQERYFKWRMGRMMEGVRFMRYVIERCNGEVDL